MSWQLSVICFLCYDGNHAPPNSRGWSPHISGWQQMSPNIGGHQDYKQIYNTENFIILVDLVRLEFKAQTGLAAAGRSAGDVAVDNTEDQGALV